jgi:hypothetical protein
MRVSVRCSELSIWIMIAFHVSRGETEQQINSTAQRMLGRFMEDRELGRAAA